MYVSLFNVTHNYNLWVLPVICFRYFEKKQPCIKNSQIFTIISDFSLFPITFWTSTPGYTTGISNSKQPMWNSLSLPLSFLLFLNFLLLSLISLFIRYPNEKSLNSWQWFILLLLFTVPKWGSASHRHKDLWLSQIFIEGTVPYHLPLFQSDQVKDKKFAWAHRIRIQICLILSSSYSTKQVETNKQESLNWPCACMCVLSHFSRVQLRLFVTLWTVARQALLSVGILQARILEWVAMPSSRESSEPRDRTHVCLLHWQVGSLPVASHGKPQLALKLFYFWPIFPSFLILPVLSPLIDRDRIKRQSRWLSSQTRVPSIAGRFPTIWATREAQIPIWDCR